MKHRRSTFRRIFGPAAIGISAFNAKNGDHATLARYVADRIKAGDVAIVLTEVWTRHDALSIIARQHGLTMLAETPVPGGRDRHPVTEQGDTVLLLAPAFDVESWEVVPLTMGWRVFSAARDHEPRRLIRVVGYVGEQRVELLAVHGPTGGNKAAVAEFKDKVAGILRTTRRGTVAIAAGDFNVRLEDARGWAADNGLRVSGSGPDLALVAGGRTRSKRGPKHGSDHHAMAHRIKPTKEKT